jgi:hypothetical protein
VKLALAAGILFLSTLGGVASAAIYYVDSAAGSNGNNGLSQQAAWQSPPGLGASGAGWKQIKPGDKVILKRGSRWSGMLQCGSTWYQATGATRANPMSLEVAASWGSGPVTLDGCIWIQSEGVRLDGLTGDIGPDDQPSGFGFVLNADAGASGGALDSAIRAGGKEQSLNHILVNGSTGCAGAIVKPWNISDSELRYVFVDGLKSSRQVTGIELGETGFYCSPNITLSHCYVFRLGGDGSYMEGGANYWIGIHCIDQAGPIVLDHCIVGDTGGRCYDFGGVNNTVGTIVLNYCVAKNGHASGFGANGEAGRSRVPQIYYNYCLAVDCVDFGWKIYQVNGNVFMNNCIATRCRQGVMCYGVLGDTIDTKLTMRNCSLFANRHSDFAIGQLYDTTVSSGLYPHMRADLNNNAFWGSPRAIYAPCAEYGSDYSLTYAQAQIGNASGAWASFSRTKLGTACDTASLSAAQTGFTSALTDPAANNFRLAQGSSLIDKGYTSCTRGPVALSLDYYGNAIPAGTIDIGASEYRPSSPLPPPAPSGLVVVPE